MAEFFDKRHDNVMRAIDDLVATEPSISLNFEEVSLPIHAKTGPRFSRGIDMDQEGFTLLAMGFTGTRALHFKRLYIRAFNAAMEEIQKLCSQVVRWLEG